MTSLPQRLVRDHYKAEGERMARYFTEYTSLPHVGDKVDSIKYGSVNDRLDQSVPIATLKSIFFDMMEEDFMCPSHTSPQSDVLYETLRLLKREKNPDNLNAFNEGKFAVFEEKWERYLAKRKEMGRLDAPTSNMIEFLEKLKNIMEEHNLDINGQIGSNIWYDDFREKQIVLSNLPKDGGNELFPFVLCDEDDSILEKIKDILSQLPEESVPKM